MTSDFLKKVNTFIDENHMLKQGEHVILGISGGADSMCLLFVMHMLGRSRQLTLTAVHVNHGLRGDAADADEAYVREICSQWEIPCICFRANIHELAKQEKMTEEEAGRKYRYECFERVRAKNHGDKIAVAHHINDLAETVLFNLFRGSRLKGLGGIAPVRGNIIRPLLCLERQEIEAVLNENHIRFCTDQTNFDTVYTRNKIRLELLPYICGNINEKAVQHIADVSEASREAYAFIHKQAFKAMDEVLCEDGGLYIERLKEIDAVLQKEIIRLWFEKKTGRLKDVTKEHVASILRLLDKQDGKRISLPYGIVAVRKRDRLYLENRTDDTREKSEKDDADALKEIDVSVPGSYFLTDIQVFVSFEVTDAQENQRIPENSCTKWMDYDKIENGLKLRRRCSKDFMTIAPGNSKKALRRVMIDDKIPKDMREKLWLLADGSHILWIPGGRISEYFKVTKNTRKILIVKIKGEKTCQTKSMYY